MTVAVRNDGVHGAPIVEVIDRGTGLGLYIARQLCEANQSVLAFEPVPGGGSCFRILLPRPQALREGMDAG